MSFWRMVGKNFWHVIAGCEMCVAAMGVSCVLKRSLSGTLSKRNLSGISLAGACGVCLEAVG